MKIGIFMAYMPGVKLRSEGLGRYIGNLIKGFVDDQNDVSIACPKWMIKPLYDLFDDFHIPQQSVDIITTHRVPIVWKLYSKLLGRKKDEKISGKIIVLKKFADLVDFIIDIAVSISAWFLFAAVLLIVFALFIVFLPGFLLISVLVLLGFAASKLSKKTKGGMKSILGKINDIVRRYSKKGESIQQRAYNQLYQSTVNKLIAKINTQKNDVWFVPTLFWPEAAKINSLTVFTAPDMVTTQFPFPFAEWGGGLTATNNCAKTIESGQYFITYCDFIKKDLLMRQFGKEYDHIRSIAHVNNSSLDYVNITSKNVDYLTGGSRSINEEFCRELLFHLPRYSTQQVFLEGFDFSNVQYIFYASQHRPHKNILNLIRAYEYLLRTKQVSFKLFMTCDLDAAEGIRSFIADHGLEYDVISFKRVPVQLLSALYQCATLVVNPTLYEGGFLTFTLGEGMSVGTPSIMGRIPQVTDMIPDVYPIDYILFDPHNYMDIAQKILFGVQNAAQLYQDELAMYHDVEVRTGPVVAKDYVKAFQEFAMIYANEHSK